MSQREVYHGDRHDRSDSFGSMPDSIEQGSQAVGISLTGLTGTAERQAMRVSAGYATMEATDGMPA